MCAPCSCLLPHTQFLGDGQHMPDAGSPSQNSTTQLKAQQMGPWPNSKAETELRALCTRCRPHLPQLTCCHGQPRSPGQTLAMPRSDSGKADPARRRVLPGARVSARCTGYSALPYGVRLPSRAINTKAGRKQQQKL